MPPLYTVVKKAADSDYAYDDKALPAAVKRMGKGYAVQRYKGLGRDEPGAALGHHAEPRSTAR